MYYRLAEQSSGSVIKGAIEWILESVSGFPGIIDDRVRLAVQVMRETGVDISGHRSRAISGIGDEVIDYVITVCDSAREECLFFPAGIKLIHKSFDDPPTLAKDAGDIEHRYRKA